MDPKGLFQRLKVPEEWYTEPNGQRSAINATPAQMWGNSWRKYENGKHTEITGEAKHLELDLGLKLFAEQGMTPSREFPDVSPGLIKDYLRYADKAGSRKTVWMPDFLNLKLTVNPASNQPIVSSVRNVIIMLWRRGYRFIMERNTEEVTLIQYRGNLESHRSKLENGDTDSIIADLEQHHNGDVKIRTEHVRSAITAMAKANRFDQIWLTIARDLRLSDPDIPERYLGAHKNLTRFLPVDPEDEMLPHYDTALEQECISRYSRAYKPGQHCRDVICFVGPQTIGKSVYSKIFGYATDWDSQDSEGLYGELPDLLGFDLRKRMIEEVAGCSAVEIPEIDVLPPMQLAKVKALIGAEFDKCRPAFGERAIKVYRTWVPIATTNNPHFLTDTTGNTRFKVIKFVDRQEEDTQVAVADLFRARPYIVRQILEDIAETGWPTRLALSPETNRAFEEHSGHFVTLDSYQECFQSLIEGRVLCWFLTADACRVSDDIHDHRLPKTDPYTASKVWTKLGFEKYAINWRGDQEAKVYVKGMKPRSGKRFLPNTDELPVEGRILQYPAGPTTIIHGGGV